ncbi:hypothetical protein [Dongia sp.]|uniref:DUF6894 family protein n=1 Tax=Dongia sp. TaxID=1977262 RepID=UPI0035B1F32F
MRRYFYQMHGERGTNEDSAGIALSSHSTAMLLAATMCAEIGLSDGFCRGFAVSVRDESGAEIGRVSVVIATSSERHDA